MQYLTVEIVLTNRKTSLITVFPRLLKIMTPLTLNINCIKEKSKIDYPYVSNWNLPDWYLSYSHNHYTMFNLQYDGESWNNSGDHSLPLNCASILKIHTKHPE